MSSYLVILIIIGILLSGLFKRLNCFEVFKEGAVEGLRTTFSLVPNLIGLFVAIEVFKTSGAMEVIINYLRPLLEWVGIPVEVAPLVIIRPISGSASLAMVKDIMVSYGPDSFAGKVAAVIMGSTETIFYTMTVYFGATSVIKTRYALGVALFSDFINILVGCYIVRLMMGD